MTPRLKEKYKKEIALNIKKQFSQKGINIEYLEVRNKFNLSKKYNRSNFKIFVAYYINNVRLIDNF